MSFIVKSKKKAKPNKVVNKPLFLFWTILSFIFVGQGIAVAITSYVYEQNLWRSVWLLGLFALLQFGALICREFTRERLEY